MNIYYIRWLHLYNFLFCSHPYFLHMVSNH